MAPIDETALHWREQVGYPTAELLFEAQRDLMQILHSIVEKALAGAQTALGHANWDDRRASSFMSPEQRKGLDQTLLEALKPLEFHSSIDAFYLGSSPLAGSKVDDCLNVLAQKRRTKEDRLIALQRRPDDMNQRVTALQELDHIASKTQWQNCLSDEQKWAQLSKRVWRSDYAGAVDFQELELHIDELREKSQVYTLKTQPTATGAPPFESPGSINDAAAAYIQAQDALSQKLVAKLKRLGGDIAEYLMCHPTFEKDFDFLAVKRDEPRLSDVEPKNQAVEYGAMRKRYRTEPLRWALLELAQYDRESRFNASGPPKHSRADLISVCYDQLVNPELGSQEFATAVKWDHSLLDALTETMILYGIQWELTKHRASYGIYADAKARDKALAANPRTVQWVSRPAGSVEGYHLDGDLVATGVRRIAWLPDLKEHDKNDLLGERLAVTRGAYLKDFMESKPLEEGETLNVRTIAAWRKSRVELRVFWDSVRNATIPWYFKREWNIPTARDEANTNAASAATDQVKQETQASHDDDLDMHRADSPEHDPGQSLKSADNGQRSDGGVTTPKGIDWQSQQPDPNFRVHTRIFADYRLAILMQDQAAGYDYLCQAEEDEANLNRGPDSPTGHRPSTPPRGMATRSKALSPTSPKRKLDESVTQGVPDPSSPPKRQKSKQQQPPAIKPSGLVLGARPPPSANDYTSPFGYASPHESRGETFKAPEESSKARKERKREEERQARDRVRLEEEARLPQQARPVDQGPPKGSVLVKRRSLDILAYLWPTQSSAQGTKVRWSALLNALGDAGIVRGNRPKGGRVSFRYPGNPEKGLRNGSFGLHKPHVEADYVEPQVAVNMGDSITTVLGWRWDTLALRPRQGGEESDGE